MRPTSPKPDQTDQDLAARTAKIDESLAQLEIKVDLWDSGQTGHFRTVVAELKEDRRTVAHSLQVLSETLSEEWHEVSNRLQRSIERLEGELQTAWADLETEIADDVDSYRSASARQLELWHGQVDRLRLHAKLVEMETRDALSEMEAAFAAARPELERARDSAEEALGNLRTTSREFVTHLRKASRAASRTMG